MSRRTLEQATKYRDLDQHFEHHPAVVRIVRKNSTVKVYGPTGLVVYHDHPSQEVKRGTLNSILRMAAAAGVLLAVLLVVARFVVA